MVVRAREVFQSEVAPVGVVSGSGIHLRPLLDHVVYEVAFSDAGLPAAGTAGHDGKFVFGWCGDVPVILQSGRIHLYEGFAPGVVASTVDALYGFGVRALVLTNAAGGLDEALAPGDLVAAEEVVSWRYTAHPFPERMRPAFVVPGCVATGTYIWMHGPCYETRAEIRALQQLGGMAVGMSVAPELERCLALGIRAGAVSCITNDCTTQEALSHAQVVDVAERASGELCGLLRGYIGAERTGRDVPVAGGPDCLDR